MQFSSSYLSDIFGNPVKYRKLVAHVGENVVRLKEHYGFDAIAFTGASGSAMAYPISVLTDIPLIYVRKDGENCHGDKIEGTPINVKKYAIIDDFISSGATMRRIMGKLPAIECVCIMAYIGRWNASGGHGIRVPIYKVDGKIRLPKQIEKAA